MQLDAVHTSLNKWKESKGTNFFKKGGKLKCCVIEFAKPIRRKEQLDSGKVRIKVTTKVKVWEEIGFQNRHLKILHHDRIHHWQTTTEVAYVFPSVMSK